MGAKGRWLNLYFTPIVPRGIRMVGIHEAGQKQTAHQAAEPWPCVVDGQICFKTRVCALGRGHTWHIVQSVEVAEHATDIIGILGLLGRHRGQPEVVSVDSHHSFAMFLTLEESRARIHMV